MPFVADVDADDLVPRYPACGPRCCRARGSRAHDFENATSVLAAVRTVLNAFYDLTEAWKTLTV